MREFTVRDYERSDFIDTGAIRAFGMRPQRIAAAEPFCLTCGKVASPAVCKGRWDSDRQATQIPFEPVWVQMTCGCEFGNATLAEPTPAPDQTPTPAQPKEAGRV